MVEKPPIKQPSVQKVQNPVQTPIQPVTHSNRKYLVGGIIGVIILIVLVTGLVWKMKQSNTSAVSKVINELSENLSPTPFPFQEMTIPYLRKQTFESKLGARELVSNNGSYSSYLTSYTSDGLKVNGLLTIPDGEEPEGGWPAIVFIHGYIPPTLYETNGESYSSYVDYLARNGFVVFKIDLRGHADSEGQPGGGYYGSDYVTDALNAYSALQNTDFVNPNKIGMWGHSMAGNVVLRSMAVKPDIPASVIWAGAVYSYEDQRKYGINDNSYRPPQNVTQQRNRRQQLFEKHGSPSAQSVFWQQVAPTNYLNDLKGSIELHHAVDDDVVNIGYSRDLMTALDKTKVPHELFEYNSGGHNISGESFNTAMQRTSDFFKEKLK